MRQITKIEKNNLIIIGSLLKKMNEGTLTKEEYRRLQKLLIENAGAFDRNTEDCFSYPLCKTDIPKGKIMFISDTHHGNKTLENRHYTDYAYDTALSENIKTVIHAGDLTESTTAEPRWTIPYNEAHAMVKEELKTALKAIPDELQIKLLLGNHDYTTIKRFQSLIPYYTESNKIDILGMRRVMLNWDDFATINLEHYIPQLNFQEFEAYQKAKEDATVTLEGHHHYYFLRENERTLELPSLSNATLGVVSNYLYRRGENYSPVFVIASKESETSLLLKAYCIERNGRNTPKIGDTIEIDTKTKVLKYYK